MCLRKDTFYANGQVLVAVVNGCEHGNAGCIGHAASSNGGQLSVKSLTQQTTVAAFGWLLESLDGVSARLATVRALEQSSVACVKETDRGNWGSELIAMFILHGGE